MAQTWDGLMRLRTIELQLLNLLAIQAESPGAAVPAGNGARLQVGCALSARFTGVCVLPLPIHRLTTFNTARTEMNQSDKGIQGSTNAAFFHY